MQQRNELKDHIDKNLDKFCRANRIRFPFLKDALFPGRRSRPILFYSLLKDQSFSPDVDKIGMAIEFSHRASIILDDLIDNDLLRRRKPTFHSKHGSNATILASHILISNCFNCVNTTNFANKTSIADSFYESGISMISGEMADIGLEKNLTSISTIRNY